MKKYYKNIVFEKTIDLVNLFPEKEFDSPYRSTICLISMFENNMASSFVKSFGDITRIVYEYEVDVVQGKGKPSCSDLLIETPSCSYIIEAKRTEGKYDSVKTWLGNSQNRIMVLKGWLSLINSKIGTSIVTEDVLRIPYQMIHRVASACSLNASNVKTVYLGFDLTEKMCDYYLKNILMLRTLTHNYLDIELIRISINKSNIQASFETKWDSGERELGSQVRVNLIEGKLMRFDS